MALKRTVYERCQRCGQRAATHFGDRISEGHDCPEAPPGPSDPPREHRPDAVDFVPGDWTAEELRHELDAAFVWVGKLRSERLALKRRLDDVFVAMKGYETTRIS